ncbi:MAG: hypothetical protein WDO56_22510 [Gammaproteobacteria bacterium]
MSGPDQEAELEAFLKRRSPLHRRLAEFDHSEPSNELDRLVLNRAREAIDLPAQPMFRTSRWALPVGLAAAILISFTVVLNIDRRGHSVEERAATAKLLQPAAPAARLTTNRTEPAVQSAQFSDSSGEAATAGEAASADSKAEQSRAEAAPGQPLLASSTASVSTSNQAPASPAPPPPPPPPPPAYQASAESWLSEINRLRAAGKTDDADRELTAFRQAYPGHPSYSLARPPTR